MKNLHEALLAFQKEAPTLQKNAINPHFKNKYVKIDAVLEAILPKLNELGILVLQELSAIGDQPALTTTLIHVDSEEPVDELSNTVPLVLEKENPQGVGSAITYFRRYALISALGLVTDEDDDGESASKSAPKPRSRPAKAKTVDSSSDAPGVL